MHCKSQLTPHVLDPILAQMEANLDLYFVYLAKESPTFKVTDEGDVKCVVTGFQSRHFNIAYRARLEPSEMKRRIGEVIDRFQDKGLPFTWWVGPHDTPESLEKELQWAGLVRGKYGAGMVCYPDDFIKRPCPDIEILRAEEREGLREFNRIQVECEVHPDVFETHYGAIPEASYGPESPFQFFLGRREGKVVTGGIAVFHDGVVGIYKLGTPPESRLKGYANALMIDLIERAWAWGAEAVVLEASEMGIPIYEKLGFHRVCDWRAYWSA